MSPPAAHSGDALEPGLAHTSDAPASQQTWPIKMTVNNATTTMGKNQSRIDGAELYLAVVNR